MTTKLNKEDERTLNMITIYQLLKTATDKEVEAIKNVTVGMTLAQ